MNPLDSLIITLNTKDPFLKYSIPRWLSTTAIVTTSIALITIGSLVIHGIIGSIGTYGGIAFITTGILLFTYEILYRVKTRPIKKDEALKIISAMDKMHTGDFVVYENNISVIDGSWDGAHSPYTLLNYLYCKVRYKEIK